MYCKYYQANVEKNTTWFLVATLRSQEHISFDRTFDKHQSIFEFFVPADREAEFLALMSYYLKANIITDLRELPNRMIENSTF